MMGQSASSSLTKSADDSKLGGLADTPDQCSRHAGGMKREEPH